MSHAEARAQQRDAGLRLRWDLLEALGTYQLMTADLLLRAGVGRDVRRIREGAQVLHRLGLIGFREGKFVPDVGFLDGVYWLRPKGVVALATEGIAAECSRRSIKFGNELRHRLAIVETHMALRQWAVAIGATLTVVQDFDAGAPGRQKATTIDLKCLASPGKATGAYIPDLLAKVTLTDGITRLLAVEVERGGENGDLSEFRRWKLPKLRTVAEADELAARLGVNNRPRFLVVFKDGPCREKALKKWPEPEAEVWDDVYLKALDELGADFNSAWWQPGRARTPLFDVGTWQSENMGTWET